MIRVLFICHGQHLPFPNGRIRNERYYKKSKSVRSVLYSICCHFHRRDWKSVHQGTRVKLARQELPVKDTMQDR